MKHKYPTIDTAPRDMPLLLWVTNADAGGENGDWMRGIVFQPHPEIKPLIIVNGIRKPNATHWTELPEPVE